MNIHREFGNIFQSNSGRLEKPRADMLMFSSEAARNMHGLWICPWTAPGILKTAQKQDFNQCFHSLKIASDLWKVFLIDHIKHYTHTHIALTQPAHHLREKIAWIDWFCYSIKNNVNDLAVAMFPSLRFDKEH